MGRLELLESIYRAHHEARRPKDSVFCGPEPRVLFREWVGTGRRLLDVGCRYGALTRSYLDGNEVRRVLRPGGRLVGSVPNAYRL